MCVFKSHIGYDGEIFFVGDYTRLRVVVVQADHDELN